MQNSKVNENFIILFNKKKNINKKNLKENKVSLLNSKNTKLLNKKQILTFLKKSKLLKY